MALLCLAEIDKINTLVNRMSQPIELHVVSFMTEDPGRFYTECRFRLEDMAKLAYCLRLPAWFKLSNGSWVQGQHGLIIFLWLFATYNRLSDIEIRAGFEMTRLCRIRQTLLNFMFDLHSFRVTNYLDFFMPFLESYKRAYQRRKLIKSLSNPPTHPARTQNACCALDGHRHKIARLTALNPTHPNHIPDVQRQNYSGHKKVHNLLYQLLVAPNGLCMDLSGPYLGRLMDLNALADSDIVARFRQAIITANMDPNLFDMLGDKIYPNVNNLKALYCEPMSQQAARDNDQDADCRASVEHFNGKVGNLWNATRFSEHQRVQVSNVGRIFTVAVLLTNAHSLFYGNQSITQFIDPNNATDLDMPSPETYFGLPPMP